MRRYGRYKVETSREDKILFPECGITKGDLIDYYSEVADAMLPHLKDRPTVLQRFPDGIETEGFYQKQVADYYPDWIDRVEVSLKSAEGETQTLAVCRNAASVAFLANQACLTFHPWLSRSDRPADPDRLVLDFDPPESGPHAAVEVLRESVRICGAALEAAGLTPFLKTTGSAGFHVVAPLQRGATFDDVRAFATQLAEMLVDRHPEALTTRTRVEQRGNRIYVDVHRNAYGQTAVAPYAVRALPGAPVSAPIAWDELGRVSPRTYTIENVLRRLGQVACPWKSMGMRAGSLERAAKELKALGEPQSEA